MSDDTLSILFISWVAFLVAVISPGPNLVAVVASALGSGRRSAFAVAAGVALGTLFWATVTALGMGALFASFPALPRVLGTLGGIYLLWVGISGLIAARKNVPSSVAPAPGSRGVAQDLRHGFIINATNPKACLFWVSLTAVVGTESTSLGVFILFASVCVLVSLVTYCAYGYAFSTSKAQTIYTKFQKPVQAIFGSVFATLGLGIIVRSNS